MAIHATSVEIRIKTITAYCDSCRKSVEDDRLQPTAPTLFLVKTDGILPFPSNFQGVYRVEGAPTEDQVKARLKEQGWTFETRGQREFSFCPECSLPLPTISEVSGAIPGNADIFPDQAKPEKDHE